MSLQELSQNEIVQTIQFTRSKEAHEKVILALDPVLKKHVTLPDGMRIHDHDYADQELKLITGTGLQGFVDCVAEWVCRMHQHTTHNRLLCPEIGGIKETSLMLSGIRIRAIRADMEDELKKTLRTPLPHHQDAHLATHTGQATCLQASGDQVNRYEDAFFVQSFA